mgnify:CR=1 FL=1
MTTGRRARLSTALLAVFLVTVGSVVGFAVVAGGRLPAEPDAAIAALADGDLDGDERSRMLAHLRDLTRAAEPLRHRWAGLLAAVALQDRAAYAAFEARLGDPPLRVPPAAGREWLGLGDPLLANVLAAMVDEAAGDRDAARRRWRQVAAQARVTAQGFAAELASAAEARLR